MVGVFFWVFFDHDLILPKQSNVVLLLSKGMEVEKFTSLGFVFFFMFFMSCQTEVNQFCSDSRVSECGENDILYTIPENLGSDEGDTYEIVNEVGADTALSLPYNPLEDASGTLGGGARGLDIETFSVGGNVVFKNPSFLRGDVPAREDVSQ